MPLIHSPSQAAFRTNVAEMAKTHPIAQALAASFRNQRQARDDGGPITGSPMGGIGGFAPSPETQNPSMQGVIQRYSSLPVEKLQELAQRMRGSPYEGVIQKIIQTKQLQPAAATGMAPQAPPTTASAIPIVPQARGGATQRRDFGGEISPSEGNPWWSKQEAESTYRNSGSGLLGGSTLGRADAIKTTAPAGSYILPADVVSGLGEGNTMAGARVVEEMLHSGPWGTPPVGQRRGSGAPRAPSLPQSEQGFAKGGHPDGAVPPGHVPVLLSDGEVAIWPEHVKRIGAGNLKRGHKALDAWVLHERKKHIAKLKSLPGPVKTK